jgi:hypothetical protein
LKEKSFILFFFEEEEGEEKKKRNQYRRLKLFVTKVANASNAMF